MKTIDCSDESSRTARCDDLTALIADDTKAADAEVQPWQAALKVGDCYALRFGDLLILGEIVADYAGEGAPLRNYRHAKAYSAACPEGEYGDVHVAAVMQVWDRPTCERIVEGREWKQAELRFRHAEFLRSRTVEEIDERYIEMLEQDVRDLEHIEATGDGRLKWVPDVLEWTRAELERKKADRN